MVYAEFDSTLCFYVGHVEFDVYSCMNVSRNMKFDSIVSF